MLSFPDELDLPLPLPDESTLIFPDERAPLAAAALLRSISAISSSINSVVLALALKRTPLSANYCLSWSIAHAYSDFIFSTSIPVDADSL